MAGYHIFDIEHGKYGELSKIKEEFEEAEDAENQGNPLMTLLELSDIIGAIDGYLEKNFNNVITIEDLCEMAAATKRAFQSGCRK